MAWVIASARPEWPTTSTVGGIAACSPMGADGGGRSVARCSWVGSFQASVGRLSSSSEMAFTSAFSRPPTAAARSSIRSASAKAAAIPEKRRASRLRTGRGPVVSDRREAWAIRDPARGRRDWCAKLEHATPEARDKVGTSAPDVGGARRFRSSLLCHPTAPTYVAA